ncbi:MAG: aminoglycoside phosphotransferase family protein, partial [Pseudomonadota bacterium]
MGFEVANTYASAWQLEGLSKEGETANSTFYSCYSQKFGTGLLKVLTPNGLSIERNGFALLATYGPDLAVEIFRYDETAAFMKRLNGPRLLDMIDDGAEDAALDIQMDITRRLLDTEIRLEDIKTLEDIMARSVEMDANKVPEWARDIVPVAQQITRRLLLDKSQWRPLHGDLHPRNIIADEGAWRVIDPRAVKGPPAFEYANLFLNPWDRTALIFKPGRME